MRDRLGALIHPAVAGLLIVAGVALKVDWPTALITAGVLLLAALFAPNVE